MYEPLMFCDIKLYSWGAAVAQYRVQNLLVYHSIAVDGPSMIAFDSRAHLYWAQW